MKRLAFLSSLFLLLPLTMAQEPTNSDKELETITFGAGCFWCVEAVFERVDGVVSAVSGYMGGHTENPSYKEVCTGTTGHAEVVQIKFDPTKVSLEKLINVFWEAHDPTTLNRQGADVGTQYRSAIFYASDAQKEIAEKSLITASQKFADPIVTEIAPAATFFEAEDYHQEFYELNKTYPYCRAVITPKLKKLGYE